MIPDFVDIGGPWQVLPVGVHHATLKEVEGRYTSSKQRKKLFSGLTKGIEALRKAGCRKIFLDGSFVTEKPIPDDFDVCWDTAGVNGQKLDPIFLDFSNGRRNQKRCFYGEFFPATWPADNTKTFYDYFQEDKYTKKAKGIIYISL